MMDWAMIAGLVLKYGIPFTDYLVKKWSEKGEVTVEDWNEAKALGLQTPESLLTEVLISRGIALDSPKAKELFELIKEQP